MTLSGRNCITCSHHYKLQPPLYIVALEAVTGKQVQSKDVPLPDD